MPEKSDTVMVIANWNGLENTILCIESILNLNEPIPRIVVIDNGSYRNEAEILLERFGSIITCLHTNKNNGYAAGLNIGIKYVLKNYLDVEYFILSNNDLLFKNTSFRKAIGIMEKNPQIGVVGGQMIVPCNGENILTMGTKWYKKTGFIRLLLQKNEIVDPIDIDAIAGACFIVRKQVINRVGLMDEKYFLYFDETDYCVRANKAGFRVVFAPFFKVIHKSSESTTLITNFAYFCYQRSNLRFILKNTQAIYLPTGFFLASIHILIGSFISTLIRKDIKKVILAVRAICEILLNLKRTIGER